MKPARRPAIFKCRHSDPELMAAVSVRMLLAHQADGFAERGVALSLSYDPTPPTPGGHRGRAGSHARPREPSIVDQLADADPRWADRGALAAGVVTGPRPAAPAHARPASRPVTASPRGPPHRSRSTRFRGPHRRPWPSPPSRSRRSGAPGGRETRRPRHGPVAGHVSGTSPLLPAFHAVGCATPGGALTRWCVARGGGAVWCAGRRCGPGGAARHAVSPVRAVPDRRPAGPRPRGVPAR